MIDMYISLGSDCSVSYNLQLLELRTESYPFDWIKSKSYIDVVNSLRNNFDTWLDKENYSYLRGSNNHPIVEDNFPERLVLDNNLCPGSDEQSVDVNIESSLSSIVVNIKNSFIFYHDFPIDMVGRLSSVDKVIDKYQRRIDRLYYILHTQKKITFIRKDNLNIDIHVIDDFLNWISNTYPELSYTLLIILCVPTNNHGQLKTWIHKLSKITGNKYELVKLLTYQVNKHDTWRLESFKWSDILL